MAFVLLPCDLPSWTQVSRALTSLTSCTTPAQVTRGIYDLYCLCNISIEPELSEGELGEDKFAGLEELLTKEEGGVWKDGEKTEGKEERRGERRRVNEGGGGDFFTHILPTMVNYALRLKDFKSKEGLMYSLQQEGGNVVVPRDLAASLLAHMFFCTLPPRHPLSHPTLTPPSLAHTLSTLYRESQRVKVRALLHYFRLLGRMESSTGDVGVRFSRKVMGSREFVMLREWCGSVVGLCGVMTQQEGHSRIQQHTPPPVVLTCFTAAHLALPSLLHHTSQQVSVMYGQPESLIAAILVESLEDNEALQIQGALRVGTLLGLDSRPVFIPRKTPEMRGLTLCLIDPDDYHPSDILQYEDVNLLRELNKAYLGFTQPAPPKTSRPSSAGGVILANRSGQSRRGSSQQQQQQQKGVFGQKGLVDSKDSDIISVSRQHSPSRLDAQVSSSSSDDKETRREARGDRSAEENDSELKTQSKKTDGGKDAGPSKENEGKPTRADEERDGNDTGEGGKEDREVKEGEGQVDRGKIDGGRTESVKKKEAKDKNDRDEASKDDRDEIERDALLKKEGGEIVRGTPRSIKKREAKIKNNRDEASKDDRDEMDRDALLKKEGGEIVRGRPGSIKKIGGIMTKIKEKIRSRGSERSSVRGAKSRGTSSERSWRWGGWRDGEKKAGREENEGEKSSGEKGTEEGKDGGKTEKRGDKDEGGSEDGRERDRKKSNEDKKELEPERRSRERKKDSKKETETSSKDQPRDKENIKSEAKPHHKPERTRRKPNKQELSDRLEKVVAKQEELAEKLKQVEEQQNSMEKLGQETSTEWDASQDEREEPKQTGTTGEDKENYSETKDDRKEGQEDSRTSKAGDEEEVNQEKQADSKDDPRRRRQSRRLSSKQDSADGSFVTAPSTLRRPPKKGKQKPGDKTDAKESKKETTERDAKKTKAMDINKETYGSHGDKIEARDSEKGTYESPDIKETPSNTRTGASLEERDNKEGEEEEDETARLLNRVLRAIQRLEKERPDLVEEASREEQEQVLKQDEPKKPKTILRVKGKPPPIPAPRSRAGKGKEEEALDRKGRRRRQPEDSKDQSDTIKGTSGQDPEEGKRPPREGILRKRGAIEEEALMNARRGLLEKKLEEEVRPLTLRGRGRGRRLVIKEEKEAETEEPANVRRARIIRELMMKRDEQRSAGTSNDPNKADELTPLQLKRQRLLKIKQGTKASMYYSCADDMPGRPDLPFSDPKLALQKTRLRGSKQRLRGLSLEDDQYYSASESFDQAEGSTPQRHGSRRRSGRSRRKTSFAERLKEALAREGSRDSQLYTGTETDRRLNRQESGGFVLDSHGFSKEDEDDDDVFTSGEEEEEGDEEEDLEGTNSSHYSFSSDYTSELEAVYEDLGSALQDLEEGNLGPRTAAIARFAHGLFKRALSETYKDVPLGLDGGAGGRSDGTGVGQQMPPRSLSLSERRQPPSSAPPPSPIRSTRSELGLPVVTGNWGCGTLRGDHQLKAMIQWAAASLAGAPKMIYYTFGHPSVVKLDIVCRLLVDRGWSVGDLVTTLLHHARQHLHHWKETEHTESADSSLPEAQRYKNPSMEQLSLFDELIASERPRLSCSRDQLETEL